MIATPVISHYDVAGWALPPRHCQNRPSYLDYRPSLTRQMVPAPFSLKRWLPSSVKNAGQVAFEMGNSAGIVLKHYHEIVEAKAVREFF